MIKLPLWAYLSFMHVKVEVTLAPLRKAAKREFMVEGVFKGY